jgi:rhamnosyltransferase
VCLAAYNGKPWLEEQLQSILAQESVDVTVFISVDASTDGTEAFIDALAAKEPRLRVLPHGQRFGGAAGNFFRLLREVDVSGFDFVSFADQDDVWFADKLARACATLRSQGAAAYSSNVTAFWPDGRELLVNKAQPQRRWDFLFESAGPGCTFVMEAGLIRQFKEAFEARWDELADVALHDWFMYAFARAHGYRWVIDPRPGMRYRQHAANQFGVNRGLRANLDRLNKMMKGWLLEQARLIAGLVGLGADPFVRRWSGGNRAGVFWLACHAMQCRRRFRDQVFFFVSLVILAVAGRPCVER